MADLQITRALYSGGNAKVMDRNVQQFWGAHDGARQDLLIGAEARTDPFTEGALVRLFPEARCVIRIGVDAVATTETGETIGPSPDGILRFVAAGQRISVIAP